jgi:hypothetical protein
VIVSMGQVFLLFMNEILVESDASIFTAMKTSTHTKQSSHCINVSRIKSRCSIRQLYLIGTG